MAKEHRDGRFRAFTLIKERLSTPFHKYDHEWETERLFPTGSTACTGFEREGVTARRPHGTWSRESNMLYPVILSEKYVTELMNQST